MDQSADQRDLSQNGHASTPVCELENIPNAWYMWLLIIIVGLLALHVHLYTLYSV